MSMSELNMWRKLSIVRHRDILYLTLLLCLIKWQSLSFLAAPREHLKMRADIDDWAGYFIKAIIYKVLPTPGPRLCTSWIIRCWPPIGHWPQHWPLIGWAGDASCDHPPGVETKMVLMDRDGRDTLDTSGAAQFMILINSSDIILGTLYL